MGVLVDVIKKIGIFMLAAQAVIHFAPGQKYEKYIKLIVGILILVQFIIPINKLLGGDETEWSTLLETMEIEKVMEQGTTIEYLEEETGFEKMTFSVEDKSEVQQTVVEQIEKEVKSKLNNHISGRGYTITNVIIMIKQGKFKNQTNMDNQQNEENAAYELESVRIEMYQTSNKNDADAGNSISKSENKNEGKNEAESRVASGENKARIEQVRIDKIEVGEEKIEVQENSQEIALQFRKEFSEILGIQEEKMEVIVYGTDEENDG
ncbi:MAG: stage III sporulation protein AF [Lachnospiraceae bacterium]|nr:stage III sporulation protein AF [Lachnospiraceae bacterium]